MSSMKTKRCSMDIEISQASYHNDGSYVEYHFQFSSENEQVIGRALKLSLLRVEANEGARRRATIEALRGPYRQKGGGAHIPKKPAISGKNYTYNPDNIFSKDFRGWAAKGVGCAVTYKYKETVVFPDNSSNSKQGDGGDEEADTYHHKCRSLTAELKQVLSGCSPKLERNVSSRLPSRRHESIPDLCLYMYVTTSVIGDYVSDICNRLPSTEKDVCNTFLSTNTGLLVDKLVSDLTPHQFCGQLPEVCPPQQAEEAEESVGVSTKTLLRVELFSLGPLECELCKLAVLGIDKLIGQNRSSTAINATLEKFCDSLPDELGKLCKQIEPAILKGITQGFDPDTACKFAALCAAPRPGDIVNLSCDLCNTVLDAIGVSVYKFANIFKVDTKDTESICAVQKTCILEAEKIRRELEKQDEVQDTLECQLCKFLVQAIDTLLGENRTAAEVNKTLTQFCNDLPGELKDSCISALPDILKAILGGIEPAKACDFVKICNDAGTIPVTNDYIPCDVCVPTMEALAGETGISICHQFEFVCGEEEAKLAIEQAPATPDETPYCDICQFLVKSVVNLVGTERSMESVANAVDTVCSNMPAVGRDLCGKFEDTLVEQIASGMDDPLEGCTLLAVCSGHERDISKAPVEHTKTNLKATPECELCQFIINVLDQFVTTNQSVQQINETLYNLCDKLPRDYQTTCFRLVQQIDVVVASGLDPDKSCEAVKLCDDSAESLTANEGLCETCSLLVELLPEEQALKIKNNVCHKVCPNRVRRSIEKEMAMMLPKFGSGGPAECELCHVAIRSIDELIAENKSVSEINKTVTEVCERLTGIQLQQQASQRSENKRSRSKLLKKKIHKRSTADGNLKDIKCDICKGIIEELDSVLEKNATIEKINETLYQTCDKLPGAINDLSLVSFPFGQCLQFAPQIISAIEQGVDPTDACSKIGVCTSLDGKLYKHKW
ncbi:SAP-like protein [Mya arenaria]|uniref:SAP-like protein n=1 Tax=Mya arenaria TaxID=6604 RepID=A0ABY7DJJ4_MYAAR|nr:SAP-like protein [Mya arenaria]